jgi:PAS domain S-box-containing protein
MPSSPICQLISRTSDALIPDGEHLFELAPDAQAVIDPHRDRFLAANAAARQMLGLTPEALGAVPPSRLIGPQIAQFIVFTQTALENGDAWMRGLDLMTADGGSLCVECHAIGMHCGDVDAIFVSFRDARQQDRRQASADAEEFMRRGLAEWQRVERLFGEMERENQLILQAAGEGIYGLDRQGRATFVNPAAARMLGYAEDELVGRNMHQLLHHTHRDGSDYPACHCPIYAAFHDGEVHKVSNELFWRQDGSSFPVDYTSTPLQENGVPIGAVVVFRDMTERVEADDRLHAALTELEGLRERLERENAYLQQEIIEEHNYHEIIGRSEIVRRTTHKIDLVAPTQATVLITGESGTGKELIARAIHRNSLRAERPLIRVNCAAVPRELFESEFFGHVKGAFTGAMRDRAGRFELAEGGTLFLDEVGEIPLELQSKLLRVLQEGQFERVGSDRTLTTDVRVIAATNRDLLHEVAAGRFREDLFFRLNVFPIHSAALRDRREDIPLLVAHFLQSIGRRFGREQLRISEADVARLQAYDWPGNIRELQNLLERAVIVSSEATLRVEVPDTDPAAGPSAAAPQAEPRTILTEPERRARDRAMIERALQQTGGKVFGPGGAAEVLGLKPTTLASRIKRWGITRPRGPETAA